MNVLIIILIIFIIAVVIFEVVVISSKVRVKNTSGKVISKSKTDEQQLDQILSTIEERTSLLKTDEDSSEVLKDARPIVVEAKHVSIDFYKEVNEYTSLKEFVIKTIKRERDKGVYRALDDISFTVRKGEVLGVIGTNGAGKSTLLKIVAGALYPTEGEIIVDKSKVQILTLGTGFDLEMTGRENVYLNGAIIGYDKAFLDEHYDEIVEFAELQEFMDERVKNYSSGMISRLGFAIATIGNAAEILILDEVLSVGDRIFRQKSLQRIHEMIHGGSTVILVSHSTGTIQENCDRALWIEKGHLIDIGPSKEVCSRYEKYDGNLERLLPVVRK